MGHRVHDKSQYRALFHFLTEPADRSRYVERVRRTVKPGGTIVIATFAPDGPEKCSGLPVARYSPDHLARELSADFTLKDSISEGHRKPWGAVQSFHYCVFTVTSSGGTVNAPARTRV